MSTNIWVDFRLRFRLTSCDARKTVDFKEISAFSPKCQNFGIVHNNSVLTQPWLVVGAQTQRQRFEVLFVRQLSYRGREWSFSASPWWTRNRIVAGYYCHHNSWSFFTNNSSTNYSCSPFIDTTNYSLAPFIHSTNYSSAPFIQATNYWWETVQLLWWQ